MVINLDEAWRKYLADVEEIRQMFLAEPIIKECPATEAAAITLLHQTIALSYNLVMAPRQDYPLFYLQSYLDPFVYLGHLPCPDFVYRQVFLNGARTWRIWGKRNTSHWTDIQVHTGFWGEPGYTCHANHDMDEFASKATASSKLSPVPAPTGQLDRTRWRVRQQHPPGAAGHLRLGK